MQIFWEGLVQRGLACWCLPITQIEVGVDLEGHPPQHRFLGLIGGLDDPEVVWLHHVLGDVVEHQPGEVGVGQVAATFGEIGTVRVEVRCSPLQLLRPGIPNLRCRYTGVGHVLSSGSC